MFHSTADNIIVLYISILKCLEVEKTKVFEINADKTILCEFLYCEMTAKNTVAAFSRRSHMTCSVFPLVHTRE